MKQLMADKLKTKPLKMQLPIGSAGSFRGVIDLIEMKQLEWHDALGESVSKSDIHPEMLPKAKEARSSLIEQIASLDEEFMELCFEHGEDSISFRSVFVL
jgi:elongation factor G